MGQPLSIIREQRFVGYNDRLAPEFLPPRYVADALNCFIRTEEIVKRNGYTIIANDVGNNVIQGLRGVRFADGTKELLMVTNGTVYKWTGSGNWSSITGTYTLSTTASVDIVVANNNVYFFDGTNTPPKYNGTSMSTVSAIPVGSFAVWLHNQLHVAGISGSPNILRSSDVGDPETFTGGASSNLGINPNDGDYITALGVLKDELLVFKTMRIWSMTGFGTSALTLSNLNERLSGFGTYSFRSVVNIGNDLLYLGFLGNKPHIRSLQRTRYGVLVDAGVISDDIEPSLNGINKAQLAKVAGAFDGRIAWFAIPHGANTTNNRCYTYDTITKGWTRHTGINAAVFEPFSISSTPELYFGEATADSKVYKFDTSTSDNGTAINFLVTTRRFGGDSPETKKKWKYYYVSAKEVGNYDVTVDMSSDGFTYSNLGTLNLTGTGATFDSIVLDTSRLGATDVKKKRFNIPKMVGYYMQFQLYDTSATSSVTIRDWELFGFKKRFREI